MRWLLALSFSDPDAPLALDVARLTKARNVSTYCYFDQLAAEAGALLYEKHQRIYSTCHHVGIFLRPDLLERPFAGFEYQIVTSRPDFPRCATFFVMEEAAQFLVPGSYSTPDRPDASDVGAESCAAALLRQFRST